MLASIVGVAFTGRFLARAFCDLVSLIKFSPNGRTLDATCGIGAVFELMPL
jgi:hypothetical protein